MNVRYRVTLEEEERFTLQSIVDRGSERGRKVRRAQVLLCADRGVADAQIAATIDVSVSTIYRLKQSFVEEGLEAALCDATRTGAPRKLSARAHALLIATACSTPPEGRSVWTLQLLADQLVTLKQVETLSPSTVGRRLAEEKLKPWREKMWCIPTVSTEFVARMEDVLDLCTAPHDPERPVVCFDETMVQLIGTVRDATPCKPGRTARSDYEYVRNGTANLYVAVDAHQPLRFVTVTERRTAKDFAEQMRFLVDECYPNAKVLRVVMDNLNVHCAGSLYEAFAPEEARRIMRRLEFHYTPKHASWLNMAEIEIGVLKAQCLKRRIATIEGLRQEVYAWKRGRDRSGAKIRWTFDVSAARRKLVRLYPSATSVTKIAA